MVCAQSITDKIKALIAEREPAAAKTTLPAVRKNYRDEVYTYLASQGTRLRTLSGAPRSLKVDPEGYAAGQEAGETVGLDPQLYSGREWPGAAGIKADGRT